MHIVGRTDNNRVKERSTESPVGSRCHPIRIGLTMPPRELLREHANPVASTFNPKVASSSLARPIPKSLQTVSSHCELSAEQTRWAYVVACNSMLLNSASCGTFQVVAACFSLCQGILGPLLESSRLLTFLAPRRGMRPSGPRASTTSSPYMLRSRPFSLSSESRVRIPPPLLHEGDPGLGMASAGHVEDGPFSRFGAEPGAVYGRRIPESG